MTPGQVLSLITKTGESLKARGIIDASGNFVKQPALLEASEFAGVVQDVDAALKADGITVPEKVDRVITALPGILGIISAITG